MPKRIGDELYYSVPEAAKCAGVSRMTMFRWVTKGIPLNGFRLKALRDPISPVLPTSVRETRFSMAYSHP